jgi:acetyl esterase/lipase
MKVAFYSACLADAGRFRFPWSFAILISIAGLVASAQAERWSSLVAGGPLELTLLEPTWTEGDTPVSVVFYLKNLAAPRIGTESDEVLIAESRAAGSLVVVVDYAGHPQARVPWINRDLGKLRDDLRAKEILGTRAIDGAHVFIVPSGCRLWRDVIFYEDHARVLAMDIIAPANPKQPLGALIQFSCDNQNRMGNDSLSICSDTILAGAATDGLAVAMADHPVAAPYKGLDAMPESAWKIKAAVRALRAQSDKLNLNGRIVSVGFSRGSGMALMLLSTEGRSEFEGRGRPEYFRESSSVQGAVVMSGRFSYLNLRPDDPMLSRYTQAWGARYAHADNWMGKGALDFLKLPGAPLFLTINVSESLDARHQMDILQQRLSGLGNEYRFVLDEEARGHKVTLSSAVLASMHDYINLRIRPQTVSVY